MLVEEKVSQISTVLCIWHVFHNFISNVTEYMPSYVFFKFREDGYPGIERDADVLIHL